MSANDIYILQRTYEEKLMNKYEKEYNLKEELIIDYMVYEMAKMLNDLQKIDQSATFIAQLNELITLIFMYKDIHQILGMVHQFKESSSVIIMEKKEQLGKLHLDMYQYLEGLMIQGKKDKFLRETLSNDVILRLPEYTSFLRMSKSSESYRLNLFSSSRYAVCFPSADPSFSVRYQFTRISAPFSIASAPRSGRCLKSPYFP